MKNSLALACAVCAFFAFVQQARAGSVGLADWCVNLNGDTSSACNGGGSGNASISLASFDKTLEPGTNTLGTVTVTLAAGSSQYVAFYADYDVDFATFGSYSDTASVHGTLPAGSSYEIADPNSGGLFTDFSTVTNAGLADTDTANTPSGPPNQCCDAAFALAFGNINVTTTGTVTFAITTAAPTSGFYIEQTNTTTGDSIFLQGSVVLGGSPPPPMAPEPPTYVLGFSLIGLALLWNRRRLA